MWSIYYGTLQKIILGPYNRQDSEKCSWKKEKHYPLNKGCKLLLYFYFRPTFNSISAAVLLVVSRFSTKAVSPRKLPPAEDRRESKESSSSLSLILKSFCCLVSSNLKKNGEQLRMNVYTLHHMFLQLGTWPVGCYREVTCGFAIICMGRYIVKKVSMQTYFHGMQTCMRKCQVRVI